MKKAASRGAFLLFGITAEIEFLTANFRVITAKPLLKQHLSQYRQ
jgi:hypothetical protein